MILSPNSSSRNGKQVRLIVLHTAEGARTVESLGAFFANSSSQVSSHAGIDDQRVETFVPYGEESWTVLSGNAISENVELCGFAAWTREQWLGEHHQMLELTAGWIAQRCRARNIPIRKLSPIGVAEGLSGVCGHIDWTLGMKEGTHTDPGPGFPWDVVIGLAASGAGPTPTPAGRTAVDILTEHGILRAPEVVELAAAAGLELAAACAMFNMETGDAATATGGGHNVWGHDNVVVAPGTYVKGLEVTKAGYRAYIDAVTSGTAGRQGCGPTQLTWKGWQAEADAAGGCWDWRCNVAVGFEVLAAAIKAGGVRAGFKAYNGSEQYATEAMHAYDIWRSRLAGAVAASPTQEDDMNDQDRAMLRENNELLRAIWVQLVGGGAEPGKFTGWPPFDGGTAGPPRTVVDWVRLGDVDAQKIKKKLGA